MGLFVALSGVIGASADDVQGALKAFAASRAGSFESTAGMPGEPNTGSITQYGVNTTVMYPEGFSEWYDASSFLSANLEKPVFSLHIHDEDLWMYILFRGGDEIGCFNPIPDYWEELAPEERARWKGDAEIIAGVVPGLTPAAVSNYLIEWTPQQQGGVRAYPDDEFQIGDSWQMCDFMRKIGLEYPMGGESTSAGQSFTMVVSDEAQPLEEVAAAVEPAAKPWWKIW